jgi:hypothetical protein
MNNLIPEPNVGKRKSKAGANREAEELLRVLRELVAQIDDDIPEENVTRHFIDTLNDARYLIAKATGEAR